MLFLCVKSAIFTEPVNDILMTTFYTFLDVILKPLDQKNT